jgi:hypothetical protein
MVKLKEVYEKVNNKPISKITEFHKKGSLTANFKCFMENYGIAYFLILLLLLLCICICFHFDWKMILAIIAIYFFGTLALIATNTYKLSWCEQGLKIRRLVKEEIIPYNEIYNLFMFRERTRFAFFFPVYSYTINMYCNDPDKEVRRVYFNTIMVNKKAVEKFMNTVEVEVLHEQKNFDEEEAKRDKKYNIATVALAIGIGLLVLLYVISLITNK